MPLNDLFNACHTLAQPAASDFAPLFHALRRAFGCQAAAMRLLEPDGAQIVSDPPLPDSLVQDVLSALPAADGAPAVTAHAAGHEQLAGVRHALAAQELNSLLLCRLQLGDLALGELLLAFAQPSEPSAAQRELLQLFVAHLSAILAQRHSAGRIAALDSERVLLILLQQISAYANRAHSFEDVLRFAMDHVCAYTRWPLGHAFWLRDRQGQTHVSSGIWHCSLDGEITAFTSATGGMTVAPGKGWLGSIAAGAPGGWRRLDDGVGDDDDGQRLQLARQLALASAYIVPVRANNRSYAILEFFSADDGPPAAHVAEALDLVAAQLARVAAREETQRALRRSQQMLGEAQHLAHLGSWEWDINAGLLTWSDELYHIFGLDPDSFEPSYEEYIARVHPDDRARVEAMVQQAIQRREYFDFVHRIIRNDGLVRILRAHGSPVVDEEGAVVRMYGSGQDVTDTHQTEEALRKSEESYRTLARNIPDAIIALYDHDLNLTLVEGAISPFGPTRIPAGATMRQVLPDGGDESNLQPFYEALAGRAQIFERKYDDSTFLIQALPVRDEDGQIFAGIAMAQDITARKEAEQKLILRAQQLSALHEMGQTVAASLSLEVVFRRVLETLRPLLQAEGVFVLLVENAQQLVFAAANEVGVGNLTGQRVPASRGVAGDVLRTGRLQFLQGEETLERVYHELKDVAHYHPRTIIAAPMHLHGQLIGVMEAVHSRPDAFGDEERAMMETAANWVAIAIGNARQHERLQQQLQESEALGEISRALSQTLDLERILDLIVHSARDLMAHAHSSAFYFLDRDTAQLSLAAKAGAAGGEALAVERDFLAHALQALPQDKSGVAEPINYRHDDNALLALPVIGREGSVGLLAVQSDAGGGFSANDRRLLTLLGRQAALAVENARLFQAQQQARRAADTLRAANVALSQSLQLSTVLDTLLRYARQLIGFDEALVLLAHQNDAFRLYAASHLPSAPAQLFYGHNYPALQQVLDGRSPQIWQPEPGDEIALLPPELDPRPATWLLAPLFSADNPLGLLMLGSNHPAGYSDRQAVLAEGLAAQATIAIHNARLFAEVQASQVRLRLLSRQIVGAQEEERQRISRELHDEAGQALTALKISLEMLRAAWPDVPDAFDAQLGEAINMTDNTMEQIRLLAHDLRPPVLDTFGLATSIEGLSRDFGRRTGLEIAFHTDSLPPLPDAVAISFYRFVQETLTNVARHARANQVSIELRHDSDKIIVRVTDDGIGFNVDDLHQAPHDRAGIGLMGLQDRFELLSGWTEIETAPGQGTSVSAYVPYQEDE